MKLYYSPGACSLSPHIVLREAGLKFDLKKVDLKTKNMDGGGSLLSISEKGQVPVLELDNGQRLTEGPAIVQYLADQKPASGLAPANGTMERYRLQEWLNFITSELHKGFSPLFRDTTPAEFKTIAKANLADRFDYLDRHLAKNKFLMGEGFTVADAYAFTVINWCNFLKIDLGKWPNIGAYLKRVAARPKVQETLKAEGLVK
jgi:glutathione S-transferase